MIDFHWLISSASVKAVDRTELCSKWREHNTDAFVASHWVGRMEKQEIRNPESGIWNRKRNRNQNRGTNKWMLQHVEYGVTLILRLLLSPLSLQDGWWYAESLSIKLSLGWCSYYANLLSFVGRDKPPVNWLKCKYVLKFEFVKGVTTQSKEVTK